MPDNSDPRIGLVVQYMLQGKTNDWIAGQINLGVRHLWTLRQKHGIDEMVREIARDQLQSNLRAMQHHLTRAVEVQGELLESPEEDPPEGMTDEQVDAWEAGQRVRQGRDKIRQAASKEIAGWTLKAAEVAASREQRSSGDSAGLTDDQLIARALSARNVGDDEGGEG